MLEKRKILEFCGKTSKLHYNLLCVLISLLPKKRGLRKMTRLVARFFDLNNSVILEYESQFAYRVFLCDAYWVRLLFADVSYEPEVGFVIDALKEYTDIFVDGGANKGFWSLYAATRYPCVVAVEASPSTFIVLKAMVAEFNSNVSLVLGALHSESGKNMELIKSEVRHGSAHLSNLSLKWQGERKSDEIIEKTSTITLDDLIPIGKPAVIKLDVEGAEINAVLGAKRTLADGSIIIYEDHAKDDDSVITQWFLRHDFDIWYVDDNQQVRKLSSIQQVNDIKNERYRGYNFVANAKNSPLADRLSSLSDY